MVAVKRFGFFLFLLMIMSLSLVHPAASAVLFLESGSDATQGFEFWTSTTGTVASDTAVKNTGPRSIKLTTSAGGSPASVSSTPALASTGSLSFYLYQDNLPTATLGVALMQDNVSTIIFELCVTSGGILQLYSSDCTSQVGSNGSTITAATWNRISMAWTITATNNYKVYVWLNGAQTISCDPCTAPSLGGTAPTKLTVGWVKGATGNSLSNHIDDIYTDNAACCADPGNIRVTAKLPSTVNDNLWDTSLGTGAVNERPLSETNGKEQKSTTQAKQDYTLETASGGDVDVSAQTIVARSAWVWAKVDTANGSVVQSTSNNSKTTGTTLVFSSLTTTTGNAIVVAIALDPSAGTISVADSGSNSYTCSASLDVTNGSGTAGVRTAMCYALNITGFSSGNVTITHPSVAARSGAVFELKNVNTSSALDKTSTATGSSGTSATTNATATTTQANEVVLAAWGVESATAPTSPSITNTVIPVSTSNATAGGGDTSNIGIRMEAACQTATSTHTGTATVGTGKLNANVIGTWLSSRCDGGTPAIVDNGGTSSVTLTATSAFYSVITATSSYPSNAAGIGMQSTGSSERTFFYEGGMLIAYKPAAGACKQKVTLVAVGTRCGARQMEK